MSPLLGERQDTQPGSPAQVSRNACRVFCVCRVVASIAAGTALAGSGTVVDQHGSTRWRGRAHAAVLQAGAGPGSRTGTSPTGGRGRELYPLRAASLLDSAGVTAAWSGALI